MIYNMKRHTLELQNDFIKIFNRHIMKIGFHWQQLQNKHPLQSWG